MGVALRIQPKAVSVAPGTWQGPTKQNCFPHRVGPLGKEVAEQDTGGWVVTVLFLFLLSPKIFEMMDAKARQDCVKEIGLLKVSALSRMVSEDSPLLSWNRTDWTRRVKGGCPRV